MQTVNEASDKQIMEAAEAKDRNRDRAVAVNRSAKGEAYVTMRGGSIVTVFDKDLLINRGKVKKQWWEYQG
jgi:hypothetical protein